MAVEKGNEDALLLCGCPRGVGPLVSLASAPSRRSECAGSRRVRVGGWVCGCEAAASSGRGQGRLLPRGRRATRGRMVPVGVRMRRVRVRVRMPVRPRRARHGRSDGRGARRDPRLRRVQPARLLLRQPADRDRRVDRDHRRLLRLRRGRKVVRAAVERGRRRRRHEVYALQGHVGLDRAQADEARAGAGQELARDVRVEL